MRTDLENIHEMCVSRKKVFVDYAEFYHLPSTHTYAFLHMCTGVYVCGMITSFLAYSGEKDSIEEHQERLTLESGFGKGECGKRSHFSIYTSVLLE